MDNGLEKTTDGLPLDFTPPPLEAPETATQAELNFSAPSPESHPEAAFDASDAAPAVEPEPAADWNAEPVSAEPEAEVPAMDLTAETVSAEPEAEVPVSPAAAPVIPDAAVEPQPEAMPRPASQNPSNRPAGVAPAIAAEDTSSLPAGWLDYSYGKLLKALRERSGMSLKELEGHTMITSDYLRNLEEENLKQLPPVVYVVAYLRTLCRFYRIPADQVEKIIQPLKGQVVHCVNDNIMQGMDIDDSVQKAEVRKIRKYALTGIILLLAVILLLVLLFVHRTGEPGGAANGQNVRFDRGGIYRLLEPPTPELPEIPASL